MSEKQASSEIAQSREREMESRRRYAAWIRDHKTASEAEVWQAAERDTRERCAQDAKTIANLADEIYMSLRNFVDHAADCMYHRTDSPHGDVCVCRVQERCREIRAKVKQAHELAERIRGKE